MKDIEVLVIGRACVDNIAVVNNFPRENQKAPFEFKVIEGGGQGSTCACCISRLGGRIIYIGKIGDDEEGQFCLKRLNDFGVNTKFVEIIKKGNTPVAYIFVTKDNGNRTIIYERYNLPKEEITSQLKHLISSSKVILLDPQVTYLSKGLKSLTGKTKQIVYDCERWREGIEEMMEIADFFIPSADFLESIIENSNMNFSLSKKIFILNEKIRGNLIVTNGDDGAYYIENNILHHVFAPKINVRDTIGAGDNFHGAFSLAISRGFNLHESVRFSVSVSALSCREYGGRNGIPDIELALNFSSGLKTEIMDKIE